MPPLRVNTGSGSTATPASLAASGKLAGAKSTSPSTPWAYTSLSAYNRVTAQYADIAAANARNAFLIRQAQLRAQEEARRRALEEERRRREMERMQAQQIANRQALAEQQGGIPISETPFAGATPAQIQAFLGPQGPQAVSNLTAGQGPMEEGFSIRGLAGRLTMAGEEIEQNKQLELVRQIMANSQDTIAKAKAATAGNIYEEINALEENYNYRVMQTAIDVWGQPREQMAFNPDTGRMEVAGLDWSYTVEGAEGWGRPDAYLGLAPGQVPFRRPKAPKEDAPYEEWVAYRNKLQQSIRKPLYKEDSVMETLWNMGTEGVRKFQKMLLQGQFYDTNDNVKLGVIGAKEIAWMRDLMTYANINGYTWEQQLEFELEGAAKAAAQSSGGGGYGGGGGGGGTTTYKQIQYTQTSIAQARSLLVNILKEALGREPTDSEVTKFVALLNKAESKSPTKTVTRTTTEGDMTTAVSRMTPSGVDAEYLAREFARGIGGGEPFQANAETNYLAGLLESLGRASV